MKSTFTQNTERLFMQINSIIILRLHRKHLLTRAFTFRTLFCLLLICCQAYSGSSQSTSILIEQYLKQEQEKSQWQQSDMADWVITDSYTDRVNGITYSYINQRYHQIPVYNAISSMAIKNDSVVHFAPVIISDIARKVNSDRPAIIARDAIDYAVKYLIGTDATYAELIDFDEETNLFLFEVPDYSHHEVKVHLVYQNIENRLRLAWNVSIEMKNSSDWWNIRIDAMNGSELSKDNYTVECNAEYTAYPYPVEAPSFGVRSLLCDPADPLASPFGWHDENGVVGAEYTITRGNNVYAYEDQDADNLPGYSPNSPTLQFNYPIDFNLPPVSNIDASITNLFYANNRIHDYLHHFGFTESAGNFQQTNYGAGGLASDPVSAHGLDGAGLNNANFSTPPDGSAPRMQMFLWNASCSSLLLTNMGSVAVNTAVFSTMNVTIIGDVVLVNDGTSVTTDACNPIINNIAGKIALIDRGTCSFVDKVQNAMNAGAIGVIIANNAPGAPMVMTGSLFPSVPVVSISQNNGVLLKAQLLSGPIQATISTCAETRDASFDNGIIAHEYAHGLSNRLTGGPSNTSCLGNAEQGGEGWSDWLALMMTIEPSDIGPGFLNQARAMGSFSNGISSGIRLYPYSTNMSTNPLTYANLGVPPVNTQVHNIGEVWCSAIWDMSSFLINDFGFSPDPTVVSAGNNIAMRLVLEGMKLQPCNPGFLDARDAILVADALLYNNAHRCRIWEAFARRGMGADAVQGSSFSATDQTAGFALPNFCSTATQTPVAAFSSDFSMVPCTGIVQFTDASTDVFNWLWSFGDGATSILQNPSHQYNSPGIYVVTLIVDNPLGADTVVHSIVVTSPFTVNVNASPTLVCAGSDVQIEAIASGSNNVNYNVSNISYLPLNGTPTYVSLSDDMMSGVLPIGFAFDFYGQTYNDFYISSNGFITFSSGQPAFPVYGPNLPSNSMPNNLIALAWNDLYPEGFPSAVGYFLDGIAPNRKLVVQYNVNHFGGSGFPFEVQAILYEGTNAIEIHTTTISDVSTYNVDAKTTQGVENQDGTRANAVPGRNRAHFAASNDAYRFEPVVNYTYNWTPGNLNGSTQTVTAVPNLSYTVAVSDGGGCIMPPFVTPAIQVNSAPSFAVCPSGQLAYTSSNSCDNTVYYAQTPSASGSPSPTYTYAFSGATTGNGSGDGSGSTFNIGTTNVTVTASNSCGSASCSFDVIVNDTIKPILTCPSQVSVSHNSGLCAGSVNLGAPVATDNCSFTGNALHFDGVDDYVHLPSSSLAGVTSFTIETWIKPQSNSLGFVFEGANTSNPSLEGGGTNLAFWLNDNTFVPTGPLTLGQWYHIACTYDDASHAQSLYVDGVLKGTVTAAGPGALGNMFLGMRVGQIYPYHGSIDEFRIWNVARSQSQIEANMHAELNPQPGLMLVHHFNQGDANGNNPGITTNLDASGNNIHGNLHHFALNGSSSNWVCGVSGCLNNNAPNGAQFPVGTSSVIWTATDMSGNTATCTQTVTVLSPSGSTNATACNSYTWIENNNAVYTTSGTYTQTFTTSYSCDSVHTLNLTIKQSSSSMASISQKGCYTWAATNTTYTVSGNYAFTTTNAVGCDSVSTLQLTILPGVLLNAKVLLGGAYDPNLGLMRDSLRNKGLIPLIEPYTNPPYNKTPIGGPSGESVSLSVLSQTGPTAILDWILLELRDAMNSSNIVANKRALLQRNGNIVATDGSSSVEFPTVSNGNYYLSVKHRNHLGIMTANAIALNGCVAASVDLSTPSLAYTNLSILNPPRQMFGTVYAMWPSDANNNKNVKYNGLNNDKDFVLSSLGGVAFLNATLSNVYRSEDVNMDGKVRFNNTDNDRAVILMTVGVNTPNSIMSQHTPN